MQIIFNGKENPPNGNYLRECKAMPNPLLVQAPIAQPKEQSQGTHMARAHTYGLGAVFRQVGNES